MPLNERNVRGFHRKLYAGINQKVRAIIRQDGMNASNTRTVVLYNCRWERISKRGQPQDGEASSDQRRTLHIPQSEMDRVGVIHINAMFIFIDREGRYWMPESDDTIEQKLMQQHWCVPCQRTNPIPTPGA